MVTYDELYLRYDEATLIPYSELLSTKEWQDRRRNIIKRDRHCKECGKIETASLYFGKGRVAHIWWGEDKYHRIKLADGTYIDSELPEMIQADKPYHLHVHHKYYVFGKLPWEYPDVSAP